MQLFGNLGMGGVGKTKQAEKRRELHSRALNFANMSSIDINESGRPLAPTEISYIARHGSRAPAFTASTLPPLSLWPAWRVGREREGDLNLFWKSWTFPKACVRIRYFRTVQTGISVISDRVEDGTGWRMGIGVWVSLRWAWHVWCRLTRGFLLVSELS